MFFSTNKCIFAAQNKYQTMNKEDEVSLFLKRFKDKAKIFGIIFRDDRGKILKPYWTWKLQPSNVSKSSKT